MTDSWYPPISMLPILQMVMTYPCWRYDKANELLEQLIEKEESLNYNDVTNVMDAVHQEGASWTIETLVADLVNGVMYLYYFYQYDDPVIINVKDELANPREAGPLSKLFPEDVQQEAAKRYRQVTKSIRINNVIGRSWSCPDNYQHDFTVYSSSRTKGLRFWIPAVIVLGPVRSDLQNLLSLNPAKTSLGRKALIETIGNLYLCYCLPGCT